MVSRRCCSATTKGQSRRISAAGTGRLRDHHHGIARDRAAYGSIAGPSTELHGTMDLQGLLALDENATGGYKEIRIDMHIEADCSDEELDELLAFARDHSRVCNTVCRPVPLTVKRVKIKQEAV
jgi:hypothetical protein